VELIVLGVVASLCFASYALWRRAHPVAPQARGPLSLAEGPTERTVHTLQPGDVVSYLGQDYIVDGVLTLNDDGQVTRLYRMADGAQVRWLGARPGDGGALYLEEAPELALDASGPDALIERERPYRLVARGGAQVTRAGALASSPSSPSASTERPPERVRVYEYADAGTARVLALAWSDRVDAYRGEKLPPGALELLPGK
jgi:hypothetical protein